MWTRLRALFPSDQRRDLAALHAEAVAMACARGDHTDMTEHLPIDSFTEEWHTCIRCGDSRFVGEHRPAMTVADAHQAVMRKSSHATAPASPAPSS